MPYTCQSCGAEMTLNLSGDGERVIPEHWTVIERKVYSGRDRFGQMVERLRWVAHVPCAKFGSGRATYSDPPRAEFPVRMTT